MPDEGLLGYRELSRKLAKLGQKTGGKVLRSSLIKSTTPTLKEMKLHVPKGDESHRTYKGRLVSPGFASRSIRRVTKILNGYGYVRLGVKREAFYAIQFFDERPGRTPYRISKRRIRAKGRKGRRTIRIKPYTLKAYPWFYRVFEKNQGQMTRDIGKIMGQIIEKSAKNG